MIMLTRGTKVQDISDQLCISPKTVTTYRYRLYEKLNVKNDVIFHLFFIIYLYNSSRWVNILKWMLKRCEIE